MRSLVVLSIVVGSLAVARADTDPAKADAIFEDAQKLKDAGKNDEACAKFNEALKYNPNAVGTLLNVGLCDEQAGRYASAAKNYTQARDLAREHNLKEHLAAAEERLTTVTPLVSHLAIGFAEKPNEMSLVIDDAIVPLDKADDIVIDPGNHHIVVTAPGRVPYETTVTMEKSKAKAIAVPKLGYPVTVRKSSRKTVGKILTFSGGGLAVAGVVLGLYANHKYQGQIGDTSMGANCSDTSPPKCNAEGYRITNDAITYGNFGSVIGISGVVIAGAGAYLWFFGPSATSERNVAVVPTVAPTSAGLTAIGRF